MEQVLNRQQGELVALERRLVLRVRDILSQSDGPRADLERLASLVHEMDELFLLVVVGEYNSGKSTFINALLGDEVFAMGDLPTTRAISILRYGAAGPPESLGENTHLYHYPLEVLRDQCPADAKTRGKNLGEGSHVDDIGRVGRAERFQRFPVVPEEPIGVVFQHENICVPAYINNPLTAFLRQGNP